MEDSGPRGWSGAPVLRNGPARWEQYVEGVGAELAAGGTPIDDVQELWWATDAAPTPWRDLAAALYDDLDDAYEGVISWNAARASMAALLIEWHVKATARRPGRRRQWRSAGFSTRED